MRADGKKSEMEYLHFENIAVENKVKEYIQSGVCATGNGVSENFEWNKFPYERKIKPVDNTDDKISEFSEKINHKVSLSAVNAVKKLFSREIKKK